MTAIIMTPPAWSERRIRNVMVSSFTVAILASAMLAVDMYNSHKPEVRSSPAATGQANHVIGDDVTTSFGAIAVKQATAISGLDDLQVSGAPGRVEEGSIDVQVAVVITNLTDNVLRYQPSQFELIDKTGVSVPMSGAADLAGSLRPFASGALLVDFATTRASGPFKVRFAEPARKEPILINLGAVGCAAPGASEVPLAVAGGCNATPKHSNTPS